MYKNELELAISAAKAAGEILSARCNVTVDSAEGKDIKLSADKNSEKKVIEILQTGSKYPVLSEECGKVGTDDNSGLHWIVDPLDGTANYFRGATELTCVSIALWKDNEPVLGVIYRYATDEMFYGVVGEGAFCNGKEIHTSDVTDVSKAFITTGFPVHRDYSDESLSKFIHTIQHFKKVRMLGAAALMGVFVAAARVDVYFEDHIMLWDIAAAAAIVKAAGGETSIELLEDNMCICKFFANRTLMEDFNAKGL